jgi:signal transduction histidine kinase
VEVTEASGRKRYFNISTNLIDDVPGKEKQILLVAHENTSEKRLNQQREDLIGFASHELRNPLANMVLCTELMEGSLEENNLEEARGLLARTKSNIARLNKIISELHDATKAGSGNLQIEKTPFEFEAMVNEAIDTVKLLHPAYNIIRSGQASTTVNADRYRLIQVLTNYLSNAIKYSFHSHDVWVHLKVENGQVITEVKDKGAGIGREQLPFVFSRYFRAGKTIRVEGLGLGLYLCSEIIRSHHGRVWVESEEGVGSTFYFSIPVE